MTQKPPKTPKGVEPRWHPGRQVWTFRVRFKDRATGVRASEEFATVEDAEDFQAVVRLARRSGQVAELQRGRAGLTDFVVSEWGPSARDGLAIATRKAYTSTYTRHLDPHVGHLQLRELTPPVISTLAKQLRKAGVGDPTVRKALAVLQSICAYAVESGELSVNPVREVKKPAAKRTVVINPFNIEEVEALLTEMKARATHDSQWMLAELIAYSGARPQDALALAYDRVGKQRLVYDHKNNDGRIIRGAKTGSEKVRSVALLGCLRRDLLTFRAAGESDRESLVLTRADGEPWREHDYKIWQRREMWGKHPKTGKPKRLKPDGVFRASVKAIGRPDATPYFLRHTYASLRLAEQRLSLQEIAQEMGHTVEVLASTYAHVISDYAGAGPIDPDAEIRAVREGRAPQKRPKSAGTA